MRGFDKPGSAGAPGGAGGRGRRTGLPAGGPVSSGWLRTVGAGLALGAGWGVLVRVYMRLVSTAPSFSWSGTLFIIGVAALAGAALGVVQAARVRRARRWWRVAALGALPGVAEERRGGGVEALEGGDDIVLEGGDVRGDAVAHRLRGRRHGGARADGVEGSAESGLL